MDLLGFALERDEWDNVEIYKEKLCQPPRMGSQYVVRIFNCIQFAAPRKYDNLMIELLERIHCKFHISYNPADDALESVPPFLTCLGAEIQLHQPEIFDRFITIGKPS